MNSFLDNLRILAKSSKYQILFINAKELNFHIFKNTVDFTNIQLLFMNYLRFYHTLYEDIAMKEVSEKVLKDFIFEDAYMCYKQEKGLEDKNKEYSRPIIAGKNQIKSDWGIKFSQGKMNREDVDNK